LGPFPDITLQVGDQTRPLSSLTGPVVLELWATWCGPWRLSLPNLDGLAGQYAGVTFLAVSVDEEASSTWAGRALMKKLDINVGVAGVVIPRRRGHRPARMDAPRRPG
jgi:thiol-disulfide isomerase/thioredoxin